MVASGRPSADRGRGRGRGRGASSPKAITSPPGGSSRKGGPGNAHNDDSSQDKETMRLWIWEELCADDDLVLSTYMGLMKKKRERVHVGADTFLQHAEVVPYDTLAKMPYQDSIDFLVQVSDIPNAKLVAIEKKSPASLLLLVHASSQMPMKMFLGDNAQYKIVATRFLKGRNNDVGSRLSNFFANGGVRVDNTIQFDTTGMYIIALKDKFIVAITHFNGDKGTVPEGTLSSKYVVWDNHCDWTARLVMPMMPDVPLHTFFSTTKTGPYKYTKYHGSPKLVAEGVAKTYDAWVVAERLRTSSGSGEVGLTAELATQLQDHKKQQRQDIAKRARQQAVTAIKKQKTEMAVKLPDNTA